MTDKNVIIGNVRGALELMALAKEGIDRLYEEAEIMLAKPEIEAIEAAIELVRRRSAEINLTVGFYKEIIESREKQHAKVSNGIPGAQADVAVLPAGSDDRG